MFRRVSCQSILNHNRVNRNLHKHSGSLRTSLLDEKKNGLLEEQQLFEKYPHTGFMIWCNTQYMVTYNVVVTGKNQIFIFH